jgi:ribosome biogenesis protein Tsr3
VTLKALLKLLRENHVTQFKDAKFEITLSESAHILKASKNTNKKIIETLKKEEERLPPDLRADDMMNYDKVLNWSGSGEDGDMPLTGDEAL